MRDTAETRAEIKATVGRLIGRFGGGFSLAPEWVHEMALALRDECPTTTVFRAVCSDLLEMDPTGPDGRKVVPTPQDVRRLAREHTPDDREPCPRCEGSGWTHRKVERRNPCGTGQYLIDVADRCVCSTSIRELVGEP